MGNTKQSTACTTSEVCCLHAHVSQSEVASWHCGDLLFQPPQPRSDAETASWAFLQGLHTQQGQIALLKLL